MEVDTGAAVSIMSLEQQKTDLPNVVLKPSSIRLKTYTGERVQVIGEATVEVCYNQQKLGESTSYCCGWWWSCSTG